MAADSHFPPVHDQKCSATAFPTPLCPFHQTPPLEAAARLVAPQPALPAALQSTGAIVTQTRRTLAPEGDTGTGTTALLTLATLSPCCRSTQHPELLRGGRSSNVFPPVFPSMKRIPWPHQYRSHGLIGPGHFCPNPYRCVYKYIM